MIPYINQIGAQVTNLINSIGSVSILISSTIILSFRRPLQLNLIVRQLLLIGVNSLPIVLISGLFTGMVLATQGYHQLKQLSAEGTVGGFVSVSAVQELGPIITAVVLAGRIGASITAELATMKVTEQIDALEVMATDPIKYLVVPRFIACTVMLPVLTNFATVCGITGGCLAVVGLFNMNGRFFLKQASDYMFMSSVFVSLIKATAFGMAIATIGCYKGFSVSPKDGAEGVGKVTTGSAVSSILTILIIDFFLNHLLYTILGMQ
ncbi:TPA: ABC transporter permease [Candidatus Poribacteria bacterium]|nr:ABC transporter permease [Candidatus Poribacteria bacterium]HIA65720.1 ABC transporter permease [Candidatus Poribacteria bacterium]HIB89298.1 ABC transporter permease [Candidatus Poribacteria bacterium]HIC03189.1 ABC transporter permease [Candidatus Poribacteria bacterium]HIC18966.1 ABC transporter permease [Candidatus Poribacteria bacterium]